VNLLSSEDEVVQRRDDDAHDALARDDSAGDGDGVTLGAFGVEALSDFCDERESLLASISSGVLGTR